MQTEKDAYIIGNYLLNNKQIIKEPIQLYLQAIEIKKLDLSEKEKKIWHFMMENQWSIGYIDAALAFSSQASTIRKRLLVMLAILETIPEYAHLFLSHKRPFTYHLYIVWVGLRAVLKTIVGSIILKFI